MNCFIHQGHTLALPLYVTISVIKNVKMSALTYRHFPPADTEAKHWVVRSNFCFSSNCVPAGQSELQFRWQRLGKAAHCIGTRMFIFSCSQIIGGKLRFMIRPCIALDH